MFLKNSDNGDLAQVVEIRELTDPNATSVTIRYQSGEEEGDPVSVAKSQLTFPSNEALPACWVDAHYRINFS